MRGNSWIVLTTNSASVPWTSLSKRTISGSVESCCRVATYLRKWGSTAREASSPSPSGRLCLASCAAGTLARYSLPPATDGPRAASGLEQAAWDSVQDFPQAEQVLILAGFKGPSSRAAALQALQCTTVNGRPAPSCLLAATAHLSKDR